MKKLMALIGMMILSSACLGTNNLIYCPESVTCATYDDIRSCLLSDGNENWQISHGNGRAQVSAYKFNGAEGTLDYDFPYRTTCFYSAYNAKGHHLVMYVKARTDKLLAYTNNSNSWKDIGNNIVVHCLQSADRLSCPFQSS